ncbi:cytidylate kinase [Candidatus Woesearchaeota archaeon]|jgi:predicted cytidylate kinase|nr:cytidylate kinase [Candidatus Woesearchaeota archaeon]|tara:strand:+ start:12571 stop:13110 length:540 start_codon:yes stop_codon:yes gene_type:complete
MRITISGKAGSGKSTVAKQLSEKLNLNHYSIGDLMRMMASEKGLSLVEFNKLAEKDKSIDLELDNKLKALGKEKDNFVVDGRLAAFFIPNAEIKVFLETDDEVRAERIMKDQREHEKSKDLKEAIDNIRKREESEKKRYQEYYGVDYFDKKLYNLIVDTTNLKPEEVVEKIMEFVKDKH